MHVIRGRGETIEDDREESARLLALAADGERAVRVWTPHRQVAFGRRDARREGYDRAREAAAAHGFPPVERSVGGRAVAYDGETTLAFARAEPVADFRRGTDDRYDRLTADVEAALRRLGVAAERGEPADSFCPGAHSLSARGGKLVGLAQRVRSDAAVASGIAVVDGAGALADVLASAYGALGVAFDPETVGSVAAAGGPSDPDVVREALESALVGDAEPNVTRVDPSGDGSGA